MTVDSLKSLIQFAVSRVIEEDAYLLEIKVSERAICGALMLRLHDIIKNYPSFAEYSVDVEYNRQKSGVKMGNCGNRIFCDLILHKRGKNDDNDNLIILEMKKNFTESDNGDIKSDKQRLRDMTNLTPPKNVVSEKNSYYGYKLGVFCEINYDQKKIFLHWYVNGSETGNPYQISFDDRENIPAN